MDIAINRINTYSVDKYRETNYASYTVDGNLSNKSWAISISVLLKNWRERNIFKKIPVGLLRWFL